METIKKIEEYSTKEGYYSRSGYKVTTDKQEIVLLIDDGTQCCEEWGYFWTNDDVEEFVGATLLDIKVVDEDLNHVILEREGINTKDFEYEGSTMFVNLETSKGTLQFVAYNIHNGYYGHNAVVRSNQLDYEDYL